MFIGLIEFARTPGARDKGRRRRRMALIAGGVLGTAALGLGARHYLKRKSMKTPVSPVENAQNNIAAKQRELANKARKQQQGK